MGDRNRDPHPDSPPDFGGARPDGVEQSDDIAGETGTAAETLLADHDSAAGEEDTDAGDTGGVTAPPD